MPKIRVESVVLVLAAFAGVWACSSSSDDSGVPATGGAAGTSAGSGGNSGHGGASTGGTSNTGGKGGGGASGGSGTGGSGTGGSTAGAGGSTAGAGGSTAGAGGLAGAAGESGAAGEAGAAGATGETAAQMVDDDCTTICGDQTALSCTFGSDCVASCTGIFDPDTGTMFPDEYLAMVACEAQNLASTDYYCSDQDGAGPTEPAPNPSTSCESEICAWTCDDGTFVDGSVFHRCGC
jgi:hypothetical protein